MLYSIIYTMLVYHLGEQSIAFLIKYYFIILSTEKFGRRSRLWRKLSWMLSQTIHHQIGFRYAHMHITFCGTDVQIV